MKIHLRLFSELVPKKAGSKTDTESAGNENQATEGPARISREGKAAEFRVSGFCLRYFLSCKSVSHTSELHRWGSVNKTASGKISGSTEMPDKDRNIYSRKSRQRFFGHRLTIQRTWKFSQNIVSH